MSDTEDAARYRWIKSQFERNVDKNEREDLIAEDRKGSSVSRRYVTRTEYWCRWELKDDWRFGDTVYDEREIKDFDAIVDQLRAAVTVTGDQ